jgi:hypothetical protein
MNTTYRRVMPLVAAGLLCAGAAATLAGPAAEAASPRPTSPAHTASTDTTKAWTTITVAPGAISNLKAARISLRATGRATKATSHGATVLRFPHTRTYDLDSSVRYDGGITFIRGYRDLELTQFRVAAKSTKPTITAAVDHGARAALFALKVNKSHTGAEVYFNKVSASELNTVFSTHRFRAGQRFATVDLPRRLGSKLGTGRKNFELVINVVNNSSYDLRWVGDAGDGLTPDSPPVAVLAAHGGTDRITFESNAAHGIEVRPTWRVDGTEMTVFPPLGVPTIGANAILCDVHEWSAGSPVGATGCDIGHGYAPDAHITFVDIK